MTEEEQINELVNNMGGEKETFEAACKLLARLFYKEGKKYNATSIKFKVSDVYDLRDETKFGSVEIKWELEDK